MKRFFLSSMILVSSCTPRGDVETQAVQLPASSLAGLRGAQARLTLTDDKGDHPDLTLLGVGDDVVVEAVDVPLICDTRRCAANISVDAGSYDAVVTVSAADRCGTRAAVLTLTGAFEVGHWSQENLELTPKSTAFDVDDDGVFDVLEAAGCGRFDLDDGVALPRHCLDPDDRCCTDAVGLSGGQMTFVGGLGHQLPYDHDGAAGNDIVDVASFALDSTEFPYGALARCVDAGACLANQPEHPARQALRDGVDLARPVQGLLPKDAADACAFFGRRLPRDSEWDFAAADRGGAPRGRYPFDGSAIGGPGGIVVGCLVDDPPPSAAYRAAGRACGNGETQPVGSFITSVVTRGDGVAVADMAGNVAEWTVIAVDDTAEFYVLRGGGVSSFVELLENDLPVVFNVVDDDARIVAVSAVAGFRCAADLASAVVQEPICPAP